MLKRGIKQTIALLYVAHKGEITITELEKIMPNDEKEKKPRTMISHRGEKIPISTKINTSDFPYKSNLIIHQLKKKGFVKNVRKSSNGFEAIYTINIEGIMKHICKEHLNNDYNAYFRTIQEKDPKYEQIKKELHYYEFVDDTWKNIKKYFVEFCKEAYLIHKIEIKFNLDELFRSFLIYIGKKYDFERNYHIKNNAYSGIGDLLDNCLESIFPYSFLDDTHDYYINLITEKTIFKTFREKMKMKFYSEKLNLLDKPKGELHIKRSPPSRT